MASVLKDTSILIEQIPTREVGKPRDPVLFGAVYFRRTAPPRSDWERDYKKAADDGQRIFRHWFTWNAISTGPGTFNWEPYDRQFDLAAKYGIRTVIAEFVQDAPEWLYHAYPEARWETREGQKRTSEFHRACATAGLRSMCLDHAIVKEHATEFLTEMAIRYRNHEGLYGYDVFNEYTLHKTDFRCYCPGTRRQFIAWLKQKYEDLDALREVWLRYSLSSWDDIEIPRQEESYPDFYDFLDFYNDNTACSLKWRVDILKENDPDHLITCHGEGYSYNDIAPVAADDWRAADAVEVYGYSQSNMNPRAQALLTGDVVRSSSAGKEFWHAEGPGFSSWANRAPSDRSVAKSDAMADPLNIRLECMMSLTAGARAYMNPRWRPLLDGPFFEAFGWYDRAGRPTKRSEMVAGIAKWANDPDIADLWKAHPVRGEVGVLIIEEAQAFCYAMYGDMGTTTGPSSIYGKCFVGAYNAYCDSNIQPDPIRLSQLDGYDLIYVPYPVALRDTTIEKILSRAKDGATIVFEGCPGYLNEMGRMQTEQPSRGLSEALGWEEIETHLGPDRWNDLKVQSQVGELSGGIYRQVYESTSGEILGCYRDGRAAIISNAWGKGQIITIGTMPGYGYSLEPTESTRRWFASLLPVAGKAPYFYVPYNHDVIVRLHAGKTGVFLWVLNKTDQIQRAHIKLNPDFLVVSRAEVCRGIDVSVSGSVVEVAVDRRDASVVWLKA